MLLDYILKADVCSNKEAQQGLMYAPSLKSWGSLNAPCCYSLCFTSPLIWVQVLLKLPGVQLSLGRSWILRLHRPDHCANINGDKYETEL